MGGCDCKAAPSNRRERWEAEELQSGGCCSTPQAKPGAKRQDLTSLPPPPFLLPAPQSATSVGNIGAKTQRAPSKRSSSKTRAPSKRSSSKPDDVSEGIAPKSDHEASEIDRLKETVANLQREVLRLSNASDSSSQGATARGGSNAGSGVCSCNMDLEAEPFIEQALHNGLQYAACCRPSGINSARSTAASHTSSWCVASRDLDEPRQDIFEMQSSKGLRSLVRKPTPFALDSPRSDTAEAVET